MSDVKTHYENLLGHVYEWSVTVESDPFDRGSAWLARHGLDDASSYLDLGAGFGAHVVGLLERGKQVTAVDFDAALLERLATNVGASPRVEIVHAEISTFLQRCEGDRWEVALCLGDTLTHLHDEASVRGLLLEAARVLRRGGRLGLSYRDYTRPTPEGLQRFIPVARDRTRTMHCMIEAIDAVHLRVTDILTEVTDEGPLTRIGAYTKLRLSPERVAQWASEQGLHLEADGEERGMLSQVFRKR